MLSDPIVALATPPGRGALAVVRLSGSGAFAVAAQVVEGFAVDPARTARLAPFVDPERVAFDRGIYITFPAPHSYTGEDQVEFNCHGGLLVPAQLLAACQAAGARPAAPGEFTRRAVLNGKMDLVQAEAVGDLVDATAVAQGRSALRRLEGGLSRRIEALRAELIDLMAVVGYDVDFPEEDDGPVSRNAMRERCGRLCRRVAELRATAPAGERLCEGALVVIAGRPNVGKSSLFNALLGTSRALVTATPGTTRDAIEAHTEFESWPVRLIDTAGLWEAAAELDRMGVEVSRHYLQAADLVLVCVEAGRGLQPDERALCERGPGAMLVRTKADLAPAEGDGVAVSALTGAGLERLRSSVAQTLFPRGRAEPAELDAWLTRERHRVAMQRAGLALDGAMEQLGEGGEAVLAAHHLLGAAEALEELVGVVRPDDVLDRIFSRFCIGK